MLTPHDAYTAIIGHTRPLGTCVRRLGDAFAYRLAADVRADRDLPPADRSAMDGYAVRSSDIEDVPIALSLIGEVAAGNPARPKVLPGTCVRILTGANVPPGADAVAVVESTRENNGTVTFHASVKPGENILKQAEDCGKGSVVLGRGTLLGAAGIAVSVAVGNDRCKVYRRPRVAVLSTGSELRRAGERVAVYQMRDSNAPMLDAALRSRHIADVSCLVLPDDLRSITRAVKRFLRTRDAIIITGGVSVGKYDFVEQAVVASGATVHVHGVAMKPGKPTLYAAATANRHIFGLPGNPLAALVCMHEFVLPALERLSGAAVENCRPAMNLEVASALTSKGDRQRFVPARLECRDAPMGRLRRATGTSLHGQRELVAVPLEAKSSADLVTPAHADGHLVIPAGVREVAEGGRLEFRPWGSIP